MNRLLKNLPVPQFLQMIFGKDPSKSKKKTSQRHKGAFHKLIISRSIRNRKQKSG
ncbi:MAG: hypothetical protein PHE78_04055 [Candidatus Gastranaerophilales bacterium]|nr:hypothetical protein [Candidatus Gastranaerophilales bacterium]